MNIIRLEIIIFSIFTIIKSFLFVIDQCSSKFFLIYELRIVIKLRIWIITLNLILFMTKNLLLNLCNFRRLVIWFYFVLNLLFNDFNGSSFNREKLKEFFNCYKFGSCFFNSHESFLECLHGNVARFGIVSFSSYKRILLDFEDFIDKNFSYKIMSIKILLSFVYFCYCSTNNFINSLWNVSKSHFFLIF